VYVYVCVYIYIYCYYTIIGDDNGCPWVYTIVNSLFDKNDIYVVLTFVWISNRRVLMDI